MVMSGINTEVCTATFSHFPYTVHLEDGSGAHPGAVAVSAGLGLCCCC